MRSLIILPVAAIFGAMPLSPALARQHDETAPPSLSYHTQGDGDKNVAYPARSKLYEGHWAGTWRGADGRIYRGEYEGRFEGETRGLDSAEPSRDLDDLSQREHREYRNYYYTTPPGGRIEGGFYYPPPVTTTTVIEYRAVEQ